MMSLWLGLQRRLNQPLFEHCSPTRGRSGLVDHSHHASEPWLQVCQIDPEQRVEFSHLEPYSSRDCDNQRQEDSWNLVSCPLVPLLEREGIQWPSTNSIVLILRATI